VTLASELCCAAKMFNGKMHYMKKGMTIAIVQLLILSLLDNIILFFSEFPILLMQRELDFSSGIHIILIGIRANYGLIDVCRFDEMVNSRMAEKVFTKNKRIPSVQRFSTSFSGTTW